MARAFLSLSNCRVVVKRLSVYTVYMHVWGIYIRIWCECAGRAGLLVVRTLAWLIVRVDARLFRD